jgi:2'-5' RNA ligase
MMLERMALRSQVDKNSAYFYIPVDESEEVQQAQYDVLDALNADLVTLEPQEPDRLHVTLLFIERINDDDLEEFFNKLNLIMPVAFNLEIVRTGTFKEADEKPLVLHCAPNPALLRLQQELYDTAVSMGLPVSVHSKPKYYSPHISLAYNYMPQDIKIPDLAAPFKIPIYKFVATRPEYELTRTIYLPNFHNEEVLVTRPGIGAVSYGADPTPTGQSYGQSERAPSAGTQAKREKDQRIAEMVSGDKPEPKLPKQIRIVYTPELDIESRQTRSREFVDIELGPPFWDIGDRGVRAGALAFQFGNILADEMILGLGGPHEWSRADAMLQAPPKEQEAGFRVRVRLLHCQWSGRDGESGLPRWRALDRDRLGAVPGLRR